MNTEPPIIEINHLVRMYGRAEAVNDLSLRVEAGKCHGFFGRNGAGKTTTIKCLLNLLQPTSGLVRVFGLDPRADETIVKSRLALRAGLRESFLSLDDGARHAGLPGLVPEAMEPRDGERVAGPIPVEALLEQKAGALSKGQKTQLALIGAVCADPEFAWC